MADGDFTRRVPDSEWMPDAWVMGVSNVLRFALTWCGLAALFLGCFQAADAGWSGFVLALGLFFLSIVLHEAGHALAAVCGGATLVRVQVGAVELQALRKGWRVRWKRAPKGIGGMVQTFPSPYGSLRRQMMTTVVAGPLVNLMLALGSLGLGVALRDQDVGAGLLGFGAFNAMLALANLLPWSSAAMLASDGLLLWRWIRGIDDDDPQAVFLMLNARFISGERFGPWVDRYLRILERGTQPGPMLVLWTRLKTLQMEGEWARMEEVMREIELQIVGLSPPMAKAMEGFIAVIRCEAAFSRAMAGERPEQPLVDVLGADMAWTFPALRLRCEALESALDGQPEQARARLAASALWSQRSVDRSLEYSEAVLRDAVQARIDGVRESSAPRMQPVPVEA